MAPKLSAAVLALFVLVGLAPSAGAQSYTIAPSPFQTALNNSGVIINNACIWTYSAGTTTPATTYLDNAGTTNTNPIRSDSAGRFTVYLLAGTSYKFVYEGACTPPAHGTTLRTADNISGVPAASATVDVQGVAGETLSAGQAVYLSDGSGGKVAGQWYKADSTNSYSSVAAVVVGLAPTAIVTGATGTIRLAGSVMGLVALTPGTRYFVGVAGALTATSPTNARVLGIADATTSIVLAANPGIPTAANGVDDFRLTLTTGTPVTTADVTAATTLFATPMTGNRLALADSSGTTTTLICVEFSIAIPATTSQLYDVFAWNNAGVCALELLAWTNDTTRATALVRTTTGFLTKTGDLTRRFLGDVRTTTVSGQTEDSFAKRYVWNNVNRVRRGVHVLEATASWTYNTATYRQANAAATNQADVVIGIADVFLSVTVQAFTASTNGVVGSVSIGEDSTTVAATGVLGEAIGNGTGGTANALYQGTARLEKYPAVGRHTYVWLEKHGASGTGTWYGTNGATDTLQAGIAGWIEG